MSGNVLDKARLYVESGCFDLAQLSLEEEIRQHTEDKKASKGSQRSEPQIKSVPALIGSGEEEPNQ